MYEQPGASEARPAEAKPLVIFPNGSATGLGQFIDLRPTLLNVVKRPI